VSLTNGVTGAGRSRSVAPHQPTRERSTQKTVDAQVLTLAPSILSRTRDVRGHCEERRSASRDHDRQPRSDSARPERVAPIRPRIGRTSLTRRNPTSRAAPRDKDETIRCRWVEESGAKRSRGGGIDRGLPEWIERHVALLALGAMNSPVRTRNVGPASGADEDHFLDSVDSGPCGQLRREPAKGSSRNRSRDPLPRKIPELRNDTRFRRSGLGRDCLVEPADADYEDHTALETEISSRHVVPASGQSTLTGRPLLGGRVRSPRPVATPTVGWANSAARLSMPAAPASW
jgi:hypothetical protein